VESNQHTNSLKVNWKKMSREVQPYLGLTKRQRKLFVVSTRRTLKTSKLKRGKSISNEKVFKKLKKGVPKSKYSRIKYKKKKMSQVRSEIFSTRLNIWKGGTK